MHLRTLSLQDWWWNHGCLPFGKLSYQARGDKNIYLEWSADLLFPQKLGNWKTCAVTYSVWLHRQQKSVQLLNVTYLHRLKTFFGAGTALLYILLVSVTHYNALNHVHKPADSFPSSSEGTVSLCWNIFTHPRMKLKSSKRQSCVWVLQSQKAFYFFFFFMFCNSGLPKTLQLDHLNPLDIICEHNGSVKGMGWKSRTPYSKLLNTSCFWDSEGTCE